MILLYVITGLSLLIAITCIIFYLAEKKDKKQWMIKYYKIKKEYHHFVKHTILRDRHDRSNPRKPK